MKQEAEVVGNRNSMLPDWGETTGRERERKRSQRRKFVPMFGRISQDPFDRACFIINADDKVFPARDDQRVIRAIIISSVVMEPVGWRRINELGGIVSAGDHGCADNIGKVPRL